MLNNSNHLIGDLKGNYKLCIVLGYFIIFMAILAIFFGYYLKMWVVTTVLALLTGVLYFSWLVLLRGKKEDERVKFHYQLTNSLFILVCFSILFLVIIKM